MYAMQTSKLKEYRTEICKIAGFKENPPAPFLAFEEISYQPDLQCELVDQEQKTLGKQVKKEEEEEKFSICVSAIIIQGEGKKEDVRVS